VLFENVRIFDGKSDRLSSASNVLVVGNAIKVVSVSSIAAPESAQAITIDGGSAGICTHAARYERDATAAARDPTRIVYALEAVPIGFQQQCDSRASFEARKRWRGISSCISRSRGRTTVT
jgi:hypothetical protein